MNFWKVICNLVHPKPLDMLPYCVSGFVRKIICNFLRVFRGKKDTTASQDQNTSQLTKLSDSLEDILIEHPKALEPQTGSKITPMYPEKLKGYVQLSGVCDDGPMFRASVHEYPTCDDKSVEPETFKRQFQSSYCGINDSFVISGFEEDSSAMELQASSNAEEAKVTGDSMAQSMKKIVEEEEDEAQSMKKIVEEEEEDDDDDDTTSFCLICNKNGYHMTTMCPDIEKAYVMVCEVCHAPYPCENKDVHGGEGEYRLNYCYFCCMMGHMPKMCPVDSDSDSDMAFDPPDDW